jgi:hypothetical protein
VKTLCNKLYCTCSNKKNLHYTVLHTSIWTVLLTWFNVTIHLTIVLALCVSCGSHFISRAISEISRQELQTVFNSLFTRSEACRSWFTTPILTCGKLCTGCVSESGDFKNVMNSKCFHLFSFNTYEHNVYINIQMTTIPL